MIVNTDKHQAMVLGANSNYEVFFKFIFNDALASYD